MSLVKFRQKICWSSGRSLIEIAHYMSLLLPYVDGLLKLHLPLSTTGKG